MDGVKIASLSRCLILKQLKLQGHELQAGARAAASVSRGDNWECVSIFGIQAINFLVAVSNGVQAGKNIIVLFRVNSNAKCWRIRLHITNHLGITYFSMAEGINTRFASTWKAPSDLFTCLVSICNLMFSRAADTDSFIYARFGKRS